MPAVSYSIDYTANFREMYFFVRTRIAITDSLIFLLTKVITNSKGKEQKLENVSAEEIISRLVRWQIISVFTLKPYSFEHPCNTFDFLAREYFIWWESLYTTCYVHIFVRTLQRDEICLIYEHACFNHNCAIHWNCYSDINWCMHNNYLFHKIW